MTTPRPVPRLMNLLYLFRCYNNNNNNNNNVNNDDNSNNNNNNNDNSSDNESVSRAPFHVKHAQLR